MESPGTGKWEAEYEEARQKSAILYRQNPRFDLISTGRIHQGKLLHLKEHLNRLQESSRYFAYPFNKKEVQNQVEDLCQSLFLILTQTTVLNCPLQKMVNLLLNMSQLTELDHDFCQARLVKQTHPLNNPYT